MSLDKTTKPSNFEILKELAKQSQEEQKSRRAKSVKRINVNIKLLIMIFVYTTSLFVTALKEFVSSDMNWAYLGTSEFISNMLFSTLNNFFILLAVFIYALDKLKKSKFFLDLVALIKENVEKLTSSIFALFLKNFNRERRKKRQKAILEQQLNQLEKNARDLDLICWLRGSEEAKAENAYCSKKQDLLERMSEEYLEEHIDETYVKIKETTSNFVKYGYVRVPKGYYDEWDTENGFYKFLRDIGPKILLGVVMLFAAEAIRLDVSAEVQWQAALIAVVLRLYPMAVNTYVGLTYAKQYHEEKIIVDLGKRYDISSQALEYQQNFKEGKIKVEERNTVEHALVIYKGAEAHGY